MLAGLPLALGAVTVGLIAARYHISVLALAMFGWGALNSAIPVCWSTWLSEGISDEPESGGGLMVGAIQLSIMLGAAFGGVLLDHISAIATLIGGTCLLVFASITVGGGERLKPVASRRNRTHSEFEGAVLGSSCE
jgi:predicted MFS family arabinose efflux permease